MFPYVLSSPPGRPLRTGLVLKDASRKQHPISGIDEVVSHEPRHLTDNGQKALIHVPNHFARVGHALVAPYRYVHRFTLLLSLKGRDSSAPPCHITQPP